jgi:hypothetical protein
MKSLQRMVHRIATSASRWATGISRSLKRCRVPRRPPQLSSRAESHAHDR